MASKTSKIIKVALGILLLIIAIPLVVALFVHKDFQVEREVLIERPVYEVFDYVKYLRNQDNYSKWATLDTDMRQQFTGTDGTVGFISAWEGNDDVGKGEQEIVAIHDGQRIDFSIRFIEPFESNADAYIVTQGVADNQTRVVWGFDSSMPYPMNLLLLFIDLDEAIGEDYETGLQNLKAILESAEYFEADETARVETN